MDSPSPCLTFAVIGHLDNWQSIAGFVNGLRADDQHPLSIEKIKEIFSFIPSRDIFRVNVKSKTGSAINGIYIDTFIDPDKLEPKYAKANLAKVMKAALHAKKMGAKITALGGFTSIVLEGNPVAFLQGETKFTTGNTLTAAYIVKGIEKASGIRDINLSEASLLIIGATGDIGRACTLYFKDKVGKMLLCARNHDRLENLSLQLLNENIRVEYSITLQQLIPAADIIICAASSSDIELAGCKENVLICDAGYPKNIESKTARNPGIHLFHGGMGQINYGCRFYPDYSGIVYRYPAPNIIHGCILEAMVLGFENRFENFSAGKGNITVDKMEEIFAMGIKHGIALAPFYNAEGLW